MEELLPFLQKYEVWIYLLLGVIAFFYFQKLLSAWQQWQGSVFGLEREIAQRRFSTALTILVLLVVFVVMEFFIVSFVVPNYPQLSALPTATLDLLATPTTTLPDMLVVGAATAVATVEVEETPVVEEQPVQEGCIPGQIEWLSPKSGEEISATVELRGTVNVPNLGFYKYEYAGASDDVWTTVAGGNQPKVEGVIGFWNTSTLASGDYRLRLTVLDHENNPFPACVIPVKIIGEP